MAYVLAAATRGNSRYFSFNILKIPKFQMSKWHISKTLFQKLNFVLHGLWVPLMHEKIICYCLCNNFVSSKLFFQEWKSEFFLCSHQGLKIISKMDEIRSYSKFYLTSICPGYQREGMEALLSKSIFLKFTACEPIVRTSDEALRKRDKT